MSKWPKNVELTEEYKVALDDFMKYWHENLPSKYKITERFNRKYSVKNCQPAKRILEIGAGLGEQIYHENLTDSEYYAMELRPKMAQIIRERFPQDQYPHIKVVEGNCEERIDFPDEYFDRVTAIHVLEHLSNLPAALKEVHRVLKPDGEFCVLIPCEGGKLYLFARSISSKPVFEKRYGLDYGTVVKVDHCNVPSEVTEELMYYFRITKKTFYPFLIPSVNLNWAIGMVLKPISKIEVEKANVL